MRWINIDLLFPKEKDLVLVHRLSSDQFPINSPEQGFSFVLGWLEGGEFIAQDGGYVIEEVTHWMQIPEIDG